MIKIRSNISKQHFKSYFFQILQRKLICVDRTLNLISMVLENQDFSSRESFYSYSRVQGLMFDCPAACGKQFYSYHVTSFLLNLVNQLVDVSRDDRLVSRGVSCSVIDALFHGRFEKLDLGYDESL